MRGFVVSHSNSTSNHNDSFLFYLFFPVVSHSNSTSNHNQSESRFLPIRLFLIPILHQTTTHGRAGNGRTSCFSFQFYIKPQQSATNTCNMSGCFSFQFYIKPQLYLPASKSSGGCFSFQFYIKPQQSCRRYGWWRSCFSFQFYIKPQPRAWQ